MRNWIVPLKRVACALVLTVSFAASAAAQSSIQEQVLSTGKRLEDARYRVAMAQSVRLLSQQPTAQDDAIKIATPAYEVLREFAGPEDPDTVAAARYVVEGALRDGDYVRAEIVARERIAAIPKALAALPTDWSNFTLRQSKEIELWRWEASFQLAEALYGQERWGEAIEAGRTALQQPDLLRGTRLEFQIHALLADSMQLSADPALVSAGIDHRLIQLAFLRAQSILCTESGLRNMRRLMLMPRDPPTEQRRQSAIAEFRSTCPAVAERLK